MRLLGTSASAILPRLACCSSCRRLSAGFGCVCLKRFIFQNTSGEYSSLGFIGGCAEYSLTLGSEDLATLIVSGQFKWVSLLSVGYSVFPSPHWLVKSPGLDRKERDDSEKYGLTTG